jgi:hypothetical protein
LSSPTSCPAWCTTRHGQLAGEEAQVHVSAELIAGDRRCRLCQGTGEAPYLLVDGHEMALHEAEAWVSALTQLLDAAVERAVTPATA